MSEVRLVREQNHLPLLSGLALRGAVPLLNAEVLFPTFSTHVASDTQSTQQLPLDPSLSSCWHLDVPQPQCSCGTDPQELALGIPIKQGHQCQKNSGELLQLPHLDGQWGWESLEEGTPSSRAVIWVPVCLYAPDSSCNRPGSSQDRVLFGLPTMIASAWACNTVFIP